MKASRSKQATILAKASERGERLHRQDEAPLQWSDAFVIAIADLGTASKDTFYAMSSPLQHQHQNSNMSALSAQKTTLRREQHGVVCIGFGASALSLAVAHRERNPKAKIVFLEAQSKSDWRPIRKLPGHDMHTTFMNDLITTENPRSKYTFVRYLHATDRLVNFTNVSKINPSSELFDDYLRWVASKFESNVRWGTRVMSVEAITDRGGVASEWNIAAEDTQAGTRPVLTAKRVIVAVGSQPNIPKILSSAGNSVVHTSRSVEALASKFRTVPGGANVAIVGGGEAAAELLEYLHTIRGRHTATLFTEHESLRPAADTSFDHESEAKPSVQALQRLPPELRARTSRSDSGPAAQSQLIERLYELQYAQGVKESDQVKWRFQIKLSSKITQLETLSDGRQTITYFNKLTDQPEVHPRPFDLVIVATGYAQTEQERLLRPLGRLLENATVSVDSNYRVNLRRRGVTNGRGLWLVGSLAPEQYVSSTHHFAWTSNTN